MLHKKVLHKAQSAIPALGDVLAVPHPSPETQQPQGSSLLSSELGQRQLWHIPNHVPASFIFPSSGCEQTLSCHPAALVLQQPLWNHCRGPMWDAETSFWRRPKSVLRTCTSQKTALLVKVSTPGRGAPFSRRMQQLGNQLGVGGQLLPDYFSPLWDHKWT